MSQISPQEAADLLTKFLDERVPIVALFLNPSGMNSCLTGFVDSASRPLGLVISPVRPPSVKGGFLNIPIFDRECRFEYGERREIPEAVLSRLGESVGDSVLTIRFRDTGDLLFIFFTV